MSASRIKRPRGAETPTVLHPTIPLASKEVSGLDKDSGTLPEGRAPLPNRGGRSDDGIKPQSRREPTGGERRLAEAHVWGFWPRF